MATIREIAERAGFSPATVSRILNDDSSLSVKEATRQKVLNASLELGYENVPRCQRVTIPQDIALLECRSGQRFARHVLQRAQGVPLPACGR